MAGLVGQTFRSTFSTFSDPARTVPADPTAVSVTVLDPAGTSSTFTWADGEVTRDSLGVFHYDVTGSTAGHYELFWSATGDVTTSFEDSFDVRAAYANVVSVSDVKRELDKSGTITVDDDEIRDKLDSALSYYAEVTLWEGADIIGPLTRTYNARTDTIILPARAETVTAAVYSDGTAIDVDDLYVDNGLLKWADGTAGRFYYGRVTVTMTLRPVSAHHRDVIRTDVANWFGATQRGTSTPSGFPGQESYGESYRVAPLTAWPRIAALGESGIA